MINYNFKNNTDTGRHTPETVEKLLNKVGSAYTTEIGSSISLSLEPYKKDTNPVRVFCFAFPNEGVSPANLLRKCWFLLCSRSSRMVDCFASIHSTLHSPYFVEKASAKTIFNCFLLAPQHSEPYKKDTNHFRCVSFFLRDYFGSILLFN